LRPLHRQCILYGSLPECQTYSCASSESWPLFVDCTGCAARIWFERLACGQG
jgi:hypothetical protein